MNEDVTLSMESAEFDDLHLLVPFQSEDVKVLCCPEDIQCCRRDSSLRSHAANVSCVDCRAPMCEECATCVFASEPSMPPAGLSNDMMIYYAPPILYKENVSVMEMICASVCITSMISFTLDKKYRGSRSMEFETQCQQTQNGRARQRYIFSFALGRFAQAVARWRRNGKAW